MREQLAWKGELAVIGGQVQEVRAAWLNLSVQCERVVRIGVVLAVQGQWLARTAASEFGPFPTVGVAQAALALRVLRRAAA
jgi:hypothetical protein